MIPVRSSLRQARTVLGKQTDFAQRNRVVVFIATLALFTEPGCSKSASSASESRKMERFRQVLQLVPEKLDFAIVPASARLALHFELRNDSGVSVEVDHFEVECDCLEITLTDHIVPAYGQIVGRAFLCMDKAPEFPFMVAYARSIADSAFASK